jgi:hypothetical protein
MAKDHWLVGFIRDELLSAAFWKVWGIPVVGSSVYFVVSVITGQYGPFIVLGTLAAFALGFAGSAALEFRSYLRWARESGAKTLLPPKKTLTNAGPPPTVRVEPHDSDEGFLLVTNTGGDGTFSATGRILRVCDERGKEQRIGHTAPYKMRWRDTTSHIVVRGHQIFIAAGDSSKLLVAATQYVSMGSGRLLQIVGDAGIVDSYRADYSGSPTPVVVVEVEITAEPRLTVPFKRLFAFSQTTATSPIEVKGDPDDATS